MPITYLDIGEVGWTNSLSPEERREIKERKELIKKKECIGRRKEKIDEKL